jgi:hypothetical protein
VNTSDVLLVCVGWDKGMCRGLIVHPGPIKYHYTSGCDVTYIHTIFTVSLGHDWLSCQDTYNYFCCKIT